MRETNWIADGVQLILAFANALLHLGLIFGAPLEGSGAEVCHERVGIGIDEQATGLSPDDAFEELAEFVIRAGKRKIGPDLRGGVAQPHRRDVAGKDCRIGLSFKLAEGDCGVERVWQAVGKHLGEDGIADALAGCDDVGVDGGAAKLAIGRGWDVSNRG